ncbi:MAG: glycyl-radical enzyme activating protein [Odoribacteraceae bacterium]|jgi:pyruvate formate lyase activating enzyme|nr:glycyl-radical enzyme activating protein [Odoribacteraceae bacterium]
MQGEIFDIKRYAIHDGPGIRVTVFFKGCNLRCRWCHNPESQPAGVTLMRRAVAGRVEEQLVGYPIASEEVVELVARDTLFFDESGGGVTFSGGEPLLQPDFLLACLEGCKRRGIHTCVDTAGAARVERLEEIASQTDLFLYDLKTMIPTTFQRNVGEGFELVTANLRRIARQVEELVVRVPLIPGVNTTRTELLAIIRFLSSLPIPPIVELMPYHRFGSEKYSALGRVYGMGNAPAARPDEVEGVKALFSAENFDIL